MNNQEFFIKYLDKQLQISEVEKFDLRLTKDLKFKSEFLEFKNKYENSKKNISVDESYFDALIPNAKNRLDQIPKSIIWKISYSFPIIIVIVFLIINNSFNQKSNLDYNLQDLFEEFTEGDQLAYDLIDNSLNLEEQYLQVNDLVSEYFIDDFDIDESLFEYLEDNINSEEININLLDDLSEEEFSTLQQELINKKYYR